MNDSWRNFFSFRKMASITILKYLYIAGLFLITLYGFRMLFIYPLAGMGALIIGNLLWRILCESLIIAFNIHQELVKLNNK